MSTQYNGWTNYETWNAKLWIDKFFTDILNAALREVNWREIAEELLDDVYGESDGQR